MGHGRTITSERKNPQLEFKNRLTVLRGAYVVIYVHEANVGCMLDIQSTGHLALALGLLNGVMDKHTRL